MSKYEASNRSSAAQTVRAQARSRKKLRRRILLAGFWTAGVAVVLLAAGAWLGAKATTIKSELQAATNLLPQLKAELASNDPGAATVTVDELTKHTGEARNAAGDPLWKSASLLPWLGPNFQAATEVATSADDIARLGAVPIVKAFSSLDWTKLAPTSDGMDLAPLKAAAPKVQVAAHAVRESTQRLKNISADELAPQIAGPLVEAREELSDLSGDLDSAADAATLMPAMLGADKPRRYLLLMQNNAESRATGGIPGALAVLSTDGGKLTLENQTSAAALGSFAPPIAIDAEQQAIFSGRVGKFMQDVNLTPDFPTSASTAHSMWERKFGERLDGVISIDPVALGFMLEATGPIEIQDPVIREIGTDLPPQLTAKNVVQTLLSDSYSQILKPELQDLYFAGAAKEIFNSLSSDKTDSKKLVEGISKGAEERRILLWSANADEQATVSRYTLGGMIAGSAVSPAEFGIYFNDGTGAKMDYWVKRTVQVAKDCTRDGYREVTIRVTSTNTAPLDSANSLPAYVTGGGTFGVPEGSVQTNVVAYGPVLSNVDTVVKDGEKIPFAAQRHGQRSVGTSTIRLAPGESTSLEFNFGHIVQQTDPKIVVTPTTQPVKEVVHASSPASCE